MTTSGRTLTLPPLTADDQRLLAAVAHAVAEAAPDARLILHGSRARGEAASDSDWDFLVVLGGSADDGRAAAIQHRMRALELSLPGCPGLDVFVKDAAEWADPVRRTWPFLANVRRQGWDVRLESDDHEGSRVRLTRVEVGEIGMPEAPEPLIEHWRQNAREALQAAELNADARLWTSCVNRLYYACFYVVSAWLLQRGLSSPRHTGIHALFNQHLVRTGRIAPDLGRLYHELFEHRNRGDYQALGRFTEAEVRPWVAETRRFLEEVERLIDAPEGATG